MTQNSIVERLYQRACTQVNSRVSEVNSGKANASGFSISVLRQHVEPRVAEFVAACTAQGCVVSSTPDIIIVAMTPP